MTGHGKTPCRPVQTETSSLARARKKSAKRDSHDRSEGAQSGRKREERTLHARISQGETRACPAMQKVAAAAAAGAGHSAGSSTPTGPNAAPFFSSFFGTSFSSNSIAPTTITTRSRPSTSAGEHQSSPPQPPPPLPLPLPPSALPEIPPLAAEHQHRRHVLTKERRPSLKKKSSFTRRRASSSSGGLAVGFLFHQGSTGNHPLVDANASPPPPLPSSAATTTTTPSVLSASPLPRQLQPQPQPQPQPPGKMMSTSFGANSVVAGLGINGGPASALSSSNGQLAPSIVSSQSSEATLVYQHIQELAAKRISTLEYLRKA